MPITAEILGRIDELFEQLDSLPEAERAKQLIFLLRQEADIKLNNPARFEEAERGEIPIDGDIVADLVAARKQAGHGFSVIEILQIKYYARQQNKDLGQLDLNLFASRGEIGQLLKECRAMVPGLRARQLSRTTGLPLRECRTMVPRLTERKLTDLAGLAHGGVDHAETGRRRNFPEGIVEALADEMRQADVSESVIAFFRAETEPFWTRKLHVINPGKVTELKKLLGALSPVEEGQGRAMECFELLRRALGMPVRNVGEIHRSRGVIPREPRDDLLRAMGKAVGNDGQPLFTGDEVNEFRTLTNSYLTRKLHVIDLDAVAELKEKLRHITPATRKEAIALAMDSCELLREGLGMSVREAGEIRRDRGAIPVKPRDTLLYRMAEAKWDEALREEVLSGAIAWREEVGEIGQPLFTGMEMAKLSVLTGAYTAQGCAQVNLADQYTSSKYLEIVLLPNTINHPELIKPFAGTPSRGGGAKRR